MARIVNTPDDRMIESIVGDRPTLSQDDVDALLAPTREELHEDNPSDVERRRVNLQIRLLNGGTLDDLYVDFATRFQLIYRAYHNGLLGDMEFIEQTNSAVQDYLKNLEAGKGIGMERNPYLRELESLCSKHEGTELRGNAYFALGNCLIERNCSV